MIEVNLAKLAKICVQHLQILAAVRCMCVRHGTPIDWIEDWERDVAGSLKALRLATVAQGDVLITED